MEKVFSTSKNQLKELLKEQACHSAFQYLIGIAENHSKVNTELYTNMDGMEYMNHPLFTPDLVSIIFKFRTRMFNVKNNFRNNYKKSNTKCPLCSTCEDSQQHLFECTELLKHLPKPTTNYDDIFSSDIDSLLMVAKELKEMGSVRENLELEMSSDESVY